MGRVRDVHGLRRRVRVGAPDPSLTPVSGMVAVTELADRLDVVGLLDAAIGPIKARGRDLLCWLRLLCLDGPLAKVEPKTLRYRLLHTAIRLVRGQRKRKIKIPETWPWAHELQACFRAVFALVPP